MPVGRHDDAVHVRQVVDGAHDLVMAGVELDELSRSHVRDEQQTAAGVERLVVETCCAAG